MVGHLGAAPSVSPIRTARIAVFFMPDEKRGATGNRPPIYAMPLRRLAVGRWPLEEERAPGLAPGKSGFASRRLDDFGIARVVKWGDRRDSHPIFWFTARNSDS